MQDGYISSNSKPIQKTLGDEKDENSKTQTMPAISHDFSEAISVKNNRILENATTGVNTVEAASIVRSDDASVQHVIIDSAFHCLMNGNHDHCGRMEEDDTKEGFALRAYFIFLEIVVLIGCDPTATLVDVKKQHTLPLRDFMANDNCTPLNTAKPSSNAFHLHRSGLVYDPILISHVSLDQDEVKHPESPERLLCIYDAFEDAGILPYFTKIPIRLALESEILLFHSLSHWHEMLLTQGLVDCVFICTHAVRSII